MQLVTYLIYILVILSVVILLSVLRQRYFSMISEIPGPVLGSWGTCLQLWEIYGGRLHERLEGLHWCMVCIFIIIYVYVYFYVDGCVYPYNKLLFSVEG